MVSSSAPSRSRGQLVPGEDPLADRRAPRPVRRARRRRARRADSAPRRLEWRRAIEGRDPVDRHAAPVDLVEADRARRAGGKNAGTADRGGRRPAALERRVSGCGPRRSPQIHLRQRRRSSPKRWPVRSSRKRISRPRMNDSGCRRAAGASGSTARGSPRLSGSRTGSSDPASARGGRLDGMKRARSTIDRRRIAVLPHVRDPPQRVGGLPIVPRRRLEEPVQLRRRGPLRGQGPLRRGCEHEQSQRRGGERAYPAPSGHGVARLDQASLNATRARWLPRARPARRAGASARRPGSRESR